MSAGRLSELVAEVHSVNTNTAGAWLPAVAVANSSTAAANQSHQPRQQQDSDEARAHDEAWKTRVIHRRTANRSDDPFYSLYRVTRASEGKGSSASAHANTSQARPQEGEGEGEGGAARAHAQLNQAAAAFSGSRVLHGILLRQRPRMLNTRGGLVF